MSTYKAHAAWDDTGWWVVTVPDVPGAITQFRRLDQVSADAAQVVGLIEGRKVSPDEVAYECALPDEDGELARRGSRTAR